MTSDPQAQEFRLTVKPADDGNRLDRYLAAELPEISRVRIKALILAGQVARAGATISNPSLRVKSGDAFRLTVPPAAPAAPEAQAIKLEILYEDADLIVVDKPPGLVVHPAPGNASGTLVNALLAHCGDSLSGIGGIKRPGIVHRLDKDTSGVMVAAKHDRAHAGLSRLFAAHDIDRHYRALVWGLPSPAQGRIEGAIGRNPSNRKKMAVVAAPGQAAQGKSARGKAARGKSAQGKAAVTHYRLVQPFGILVSELECTLETGRTHQIRVHMSHAGYPVIGDPLYGRKRAARRRDEDRALYDRVAGFPRQALHASVLAFRHPMSGKTLRFETETPYDMRDLITRLHQHFNR